MNYLLAWTNCSDALQAIHSRLQVQKCFLKKREDAFLCKISNQSEYQKDSSFMSLWFSFSIWKEERSPCRWAIMLASIYCTWVKKNFKSWAQKDWSQINCGQSQRSSWRRNSGSSHCLEPGGCWSPHMTREWKEDKMSFSTKFRLKL